MATRDDEDGFTLLELIVAMSLVAVVLVAVAHGMYGGMRVLIASQQKTAFTEIATAEMERLRALDYDTVGVKPTDPNYSTAYPGGVYDGRTVVQSTDPNTPAIVTTVTTGELRGARSYTVNRRITWTDAGGGTGQQFKRLEVSVSWRAPNGRSQSVKLSSVFYPGNLGELEVTPPTASFTVTPSTGLEDTQTFSVDGSASTDAGGETLTYAWNWGDGATSTGVTANHIYTNPGAFTISLAVTNTSGLVSTPVTQNVVVVAPGVPTASFTVTPSVGITPLTVSFDASASVDPDGDVLSYAWNFGNSTVGSGVTSSATYTTAATYTVTLTVTDPLGNSDTETHPVVASAPGCDVTTASFLQSGRTPVNDVLVGSNGKPVNANRTFTFTATTTTQCTSLSYTLPLATNTAGLVATMTTTGTSGSVKSWTGTATIPADDRFSTGTLSATLVGANAATNDTFTHAFTVHT